MRIDAGWEHFRVGTDGEVDLGTLLVAAPTMSDPNFRRTVVFVIDHRSEGTLGVVLNNPSEVPVHEVLPQWGEHVVEPREVFVGGPVEKKTALCLAALRTGQRTDELSGVISVNGPVVLVDLDTDPLELRDKVRGIRVFAGYAGWDADQLAGEIDRGDWLLCSALPSDVLASPKGDLWAQVLRRQGMPTALMATHPGDPQLN